MEGFLEANRIVEVSLNKLSGNSKSGDLSLRKTLLVSKVLNRAQDVATSAHMSLINNTSTTPRSSSKLLASISMGESSETHEADCLPAVSTRSVKLPRPPSPIVCSSLARTDEEEPMDLENIISNNSVLQYILADNDCAAVECPPFDVNRAESPTRNRNEQTLSPKRNKLSHNFSSLQEWPSNYWRTELANSLKNSLLDQTWSSTSSAALQPPVSPGKRGHREAFQFDKDISCVCDDSKRFKPCHSDSCTTEECMNCVCDHLLPRNMHSAPLLAYMLGKGFSTSLLEDGWPPTHCPENHFTDTLLNSVTPIFAF